MSDQIKPVLFSMPKAGCSGRSATGSMLAELKRRLLPDRPAPRHRWADWARKLAERYGHGPERRDAAGLVLLRQIRTVRERWLVRTQRFFPSINLSVQTIVRASGPTVFGRQTRGVGLVEHRQPAIDGPRVPGTEAMTTKLQMGQSSGRAELELLSPLESLSPMERVFRRREQAATLLQARGTSGQGSGLEEIAGRLERQSRRIDWAFAESMMPATFSVKPGQRDARKPASHARETAEHPFPFAEPDAFLHQDRGHDERSEPNQRTNADRTLGPVNIDQITDHVIRQLDSKVVAARERMGRSF